MSALTLGSFVVDVPDGFDSTSLSEREASLTSVSPLLEGRLSLHARTLDRGAWGVANKAASEKVALGATIVDAAMQGKSSFGFWLVGPGSASRGAVFAYENQDEVLLLQLRGLVATSEADALVEELTAGVRGASAS